MEMLIHLRACSAVSVERCMEGPQSICLKSAARGKFKCGRLGLSDQDPKNVYGVLCLCEIHGHLRSLLHCQSY